MIIIRCLKLPDSCRRPCCRLLPICRIVIVLAVLVLAVVLALRGYPPGSIIGLVLALITVAITAADRLVGQRVHTVSALPAS